MNLGPDMMRHQPDNPLAIGSGHPAPRIGDPGAQPVDPQPTIGIEHDLDDRGVLNLCASDRMDRVTIRISADLLVQYGGLRCFLVALRALGFD